MSLAILPAEAPGLRSRFRDAAIGAAAAEWVRLPPWLAVSLGGGVLFYFALRVEPSAVWLWLPAPFLLLSLGLWARGSAWALPAAIPTAAAIGFSAALWSTVAAPPMPDLPRQATVVTGRVAAVDLLPGARRLRLEEPRLGGGNPLERDLRLRLRADDAALVEVGSLVRVRALLRPPSGPAAPGAWDFQRDAFFDGLAGSGTALGPVEVLEHGQGGSFAGLRSLLERRVMAVLGQGGTGSVASAMLTGSQSPIPRDAVAAMRDSGLAHLLSVSGLHIVIVMGLGMTVVRTLVALVPPLATRFNSKAVAAVAGLILGAAYTVLTGSQVPMLRSLATAALATLAIVLGRRVLSLRSLALAAAAVLLWSPVAVTGPSFQMSFAAVLALIAGWEVLHPLIERLRGEGELWRRGLMAILGLVLTSLLAGLATTPFGLHHFGRLQLYGVLANAVAVPITSVLVMPAGMLAVLLMPFGVEALALVPMGWGTELVLWTARTVAALPGSTATATPIPAWGLLVFSLGFCWLCLWQTRLRLLGLPLILLGLGAGEFARPPDLLVSSDARLIAFRSLAGVLAQQSGRNDFVESGWLRGWGEAELAAFPVSGTVGEGSARCSADACLLQPSEGSTTAALLRSPLSGRKGAGAEVRASHCDDADILISAEPIRGRCAPASRASATVDRFSVWRDGPHAIWLEGGAVRVVSDRAWRGNRPWVPPPPVPRAREPMAKTDEGGAQ
ncbi:ComEC/Rec2 family competence protein [Roseomonas elaeocarpi]|uniref:ComEC/Rec2 family competence protein n=1 Tax=Roseomonas elaeocarpi TaxID=907779 RepID=A0ABV6JXD7_9PROT